jgi:hypothetical protein
MWQVENQTPYSAERTFQRDLKGAEVWVVAVRATYDIHPDGSLELAEEQQPVAQELKYLGEPGTTGLEHESDLVLTKPSTDVLLHGNAYAPNGDPTTEVIASMTVGPVNKVVRVVGDRRWVWSLGGAQISPPLPFTTMPLTYDRAFGGADQRSDDPSEHGYDRRNPIGTGFVTKRRHLDGLAAPNLLHIQDDDLPVGLGPIPRDWEPRVGHGGIYDDRWQRTRFPLYPQDFDERFFQCAPADQQPRHHLLGGERVVLYNLTPSGMLIFELPLVRLHFRTDFGREMVPHRAVLHTVLIEPDLMRLQMVWHTRLDCHPKVYKLLRTIVTEKEVRSFSASGDASEDLDVSP